MADFFIVGDKVQVKYGYGWDGEAIVVTSGTNYVGVKLLTGQKTGSTGNFSSVNLTKIQKPVKTTFAVGDKVTVNTGLATSNWNGEGVIEYAAPSLNWYGVRMKSGQNKDLYGEFYGTRLSELTKIDQPTYTNVPAIPAKPVPVTLAKEYVIEFSFQGDKFRLSNNGAVRGKVFTNLDEANAAAAKQQADMGRDYTYRAAERFTYPAIPAPINPGTSTVTWSKPPKAGTVAPIVNQPNSVNVTKLAKILAIEIGRNRATKTLTSDDVQAALVSKGHTSKELGNGAGSLFQGGLFKRTGEYVKSNRPEAHGRRIAVWQYLGA